MPRKREHIMAGRPLKEPLEKVGWPIRFLATPPVIDAIKQLQEKLDIEIISDVQRLAIYRLLDQHGLITPKMREEDDTFKNLRRQGLI
jgi:hypothetical protein